jgi:hypothetical protein
LRLRTARAVIAWILLAVLLARPAWAADPEAERTALYRQGVAAADAGRWRDALDLFRQVLAIRSTPAVEFSLAQAAEHVGLLATAESAYLGALADARQAGNGQVAGAAGTALASLTPRVPHVVVRVIPESATDVVATLDGAAIVVGTSVGADPGGHLLVVRAAGMKELQRRFELEPHQLMEIAAPLLALAPALAGRAPAPSPRPARASLPVGPLVTMGAGLVVGLVGLGVRIAEQSTYDGAGCVDATCPTQPDVDRANGARGGIIGGTVLLGAGAAAIVGGALWWLLGGPSNASPSSGATTRAPSLASRLHLTALAKPGGANVGLAGVF